MSGISASSSGRPMHSRCCCCCRVFGPKLCIASNWFGGGGGCDPLIVMVCDMFLTPAIVPPYDGQAEWLLWWRGSVHVFEGFWKAVGTGLMDMPFDVFMCDWPRDWPWSEPFRSVQYPIALWFLWICMLLFGIKLLLFDERFDANNNRLGLFVSIVDMCCRRLMNSTFRNDETERLWNIIFELKSSRTTRLCRNMIRLYRLKCELMKEVGDLRLDNWLTCRSRTIVNILGNLRLSSKFSLKTTKLDEFLKLNKGEFIIYVIRKSDLCTPKVVQPLKTTFFEIIWGYCRLKLSLKLKIFIEFSGKIL